MRYSFSFILTLFTIWIQAQPSRYHIHLFTKPAQSVEKKRYDALLDNHAFSPRVLDSIPSPLKPGKVLLREKLVSGTYSLIEGALDTGAFNKQPPLYSFRLPENKSFHEMARIRLYRSPTDNPNLDIEMVYLDNERIYVHHSKKVFYFLDTTWHSIEGSKKKPVGAISITSTPPGASVVINGKATNRKTPCTITGVFAGTHNLELFLPDYHFYRTKVHVFHDSITSVSYTLYEDNDTIYISGTPDSGILLLPAPPDTTPFLLNGTPVSSSQIRLQPGVYNLEWDGRDIYTSVDTMVTIDGGVVSYFNFQFQRLSGIAKIQPVPRDAQVIIDHEIHGQGHTIRKLTSGKHLLSIYRHEYEPYEQFIQITPGDTTELIVHLTLNPDMDGDGYADSVDHCPEQYGLYDGCPQQKRTAMLSIKGKEIMEYSKNDDLSFAIRLLGTISRFPTNKQFSQFITAFADGNGVGINNYDGLTFLNSIHTMYRGLYAALELGQWFSGLNYRRIDTLTIRTEKEQYIAFYDSTMGIEPAVFIPSTSISFGIHYSWNRVNVMYGIGYQWEDIIIDQLISTSNNASVRTTFDNDWLFHHVQFEADMRIKHIFIPSLYIQFKFPFGKVQRTRWQVVQFGLQLKTNKKKNANETN